MSIVQGGVNTRFAGLTYYKNALFSDERFIPLLAAALNDYYLNSMFADKHATLTVALSHLSMAIGEFVSLSDQQLIMIRVQAGCLPVILPPMLIYFFVQKTFTEGIERSGIVG